MKVHKRCVTEMQIEPKRILAMQSLGILYRKKLGSKEGVISCNITLLITFPFSDNVQVNVPVHPTKMYYPPVYNGQFTFAPHDLHVPDYIKRPNSYPVEEGQFENCDMDQTIEISVDPVF